MLTVRVRDVSTCVVIIAFLSVTDIYIDAYIHTLAQISTPRCTIPCLASRSAIKSRSEAMYYNNIFLCRYWGPELAGGGGSCLSVGGVCGLHQLPIPVLAQGWGCRGAAVERQVYHGRWFSPDQATQPKVQDDQVRKLQWVRELDSTPFSCSEWEN